MQARRAAPYYYHYQYYYYYFYFYYFFCYNILYVTCRLGKRRLYRRNGRIWCQTRWPRIRRTRLRRRPHRVCTARRGCGRAPRDEPRPSGPELCDPTESSGPRGQSCATLPRILAPEARIERP